MNSVLQQLFMVPSIRFGILSAAGACTDPNEDFSGETEHRVSFQIEFYVDFNFVSNCYVCSLPVSLIMMMEMEDAIITLAS